MALEAVYPVAVLVEVLVPVQLMDQVVLEQDILETDLYVLTKLQQHYLIQMVLQEVVVILLTLVLMVALAAAAADIKILEQILPHILDLGVVEDILGVVEEDTEVVMLLTVVVVVVRLYQDLVQVYLIQQIQAKDTLLRQFLLVLLLLLRLFLQAVSLH
jgi:hypothetical protein